MEFQFKWNPEGLARGLVCRKCGAPNPDSGDRCGNCNENPKSRPKLFTADQLKIKAAIERSRKWSD